MLRDDIRLLPGPVSPGGGRTWTLHDPVRHTFFRIGAREFEILSLWEKPSKQILEILEQKTGFCITPGDIDALHKFLAVNSLLRPDNLSVAAWLRQKACKVPEKQWIRKLTGFFYFRIPLIKPDPFLSRTIGVLRMAWPMARLLFLPALILAVFVLLRHWSAFIHTFSYFFSPAGILFYGLAILGVKLAHELGHAYAAKYFGLHVPGMGVAFMVMWPILYTDTTEAWKLQDRGPRMTIVAAGMLVEVAIAMLATLAWAWLPDGPGRYACFILASTTWIKSLAFNAMPFLRFDGYYLLSDWLDIPNLHNRAFAFGRWALRRGVLGCTHAPPETVSPGRERFMVLFAWATWGYRLLLFTGLALMVYHLFFKALGVILFTVELFWFIGRPLAKEFKVWPSLLGETGFTRQNLLSCILMGLLVLLVFLPMGRAVHVPALMESGIGNWIYPPDSARIRKVHVGTGQVVKKGDPLFELTSPDLDHEIRLTLSRIQVLEAQIRRQMTHSALREQGGIYHWQLAEAQTALSGMRHQQAQLTLYAAAAGTIMDIPDGIAPDRWVNQGQPLGLFVDSGGIRIEGVMPEEELGRIQPGAPSRFYPDIPEYPVLDAILTGVDPTGLKTFNIPYLASIHGGPVPVVRVQNTMVVHQSFYRIGLTASDGSEIPFGVVPGSLRVKAQPVSMMARLGRRLAALGIRESGF